MPSLGHLWLGTVTSGSRYAGTDSSIVLVINAGGDLKDNVHHTFGDTAQSDLEGDEANIYEVPQDKIQTINGFEPAWVYTDMLNPSSIRIETRGGDRWTPKSVFVWGREKRDEGEVVPLGLVVDLERGLTFDGPLANIKISTDADEGPLSFGIPQVMPGGPTMTIRALLVGMITADKDDAGTDDLLHLRITTMGGVTAVDQDLKDTSQSDQEQGEANIYFIPVDTPFTRSELSDRSIELTIKGNDAWLPKSFFLFGLSEELPTYFSPQVEPLVHLATWPSGFEWMSTDADEGRVLNRLPLLPLPAVP